MPFTDQVKMVDIIMEEQSTITATPSDVAIGKKFIGSTKHIESGILPVNDPKIDVTIRPGETEIIPNGIIPLSYNVSATKLEDETVGTATENDLLSPKTAWVDGKKITGTIDSIEGITTELACSESMVINKGFHDGTGMVKAKDLFSQTFASVVAGDVLVGSSCWANGEKIDGEMTNNGAISQVLGAGAVYTIPKGYHNGNGKITVDAIGTLTPGTAEAKHIVEGQTAWVNGVKLTGTMPSNNADEIVLPLNGSYYIPIGYHTGAGMVTQNIPSKQAQTIAPTKTSQVVETAGYYMEGNITVTGVDALNYQRPLTYVKDNNGEDISNYTLTVENNTSVVKVYVDNWHDNSTLNVYHTILNVVDVNDNALNLEFDIFIDWNNPQSSYSLGSVSASIGLESETNSHKITINGIKSGTITMSERFSAREFGVNT